MTRSHSPTLRLRATAASRWTLPRLSAANAASAPRQVKTVQCDVSAAPIQVWGDPAALARIVGNLIDNAVKYAGEAAVTLSQAGTQAGAVMLVDDRGPGVPSAERERISSRSCDS